MARRAAVVNSEAPKVRVRKTTAARVKAEGKGFEPMDHKAGQDRPRDMPVDGPARLEPAEIEVVDGPNWKDRAEELAFMDEKVTVMVHETEDPNASVVVPTFVNGRSQYFIRGREALVKRKYVEALARAKETRYRQEYYKDANGNDAVRSIPVTALKYPFSVVEDRSTMGRAWLKKVLAEA